MVDDAWKVLGEQADETGAGVLGRNTATSGDAVGVRGETNSGEGYGLATPDDARVGGTVEADTVRASVGPGGVRHPGEGEVQAAIDEAHSSPGPGVVRLRAGTTYEPTAPWTVKERVTLDYNGAVVVPKTDADVHRVHPQARVLDPMVDLTGLTYSSAVFRFEASYGNRYNVPDRTVVRGGTTVGTNGEGTVFSLHQNGEDDWVTAVHVDHNVGGVGTVVDLDSEHGGGWLNGNYFAGYWRDFRVGIHQCGEGAVVNQFAPLMQCTKPENSTGAGSKVAWKVENGAQSVFRGELWDPQKCTDVAWHLTEGAEWYNTLRSTVWITPDHVRDESGVKQIFAPAGREDRRYDHVSGNYRELRWANGHLSQVVYDADADDRSMSYQLAPSGRILLKSPIGQLRDVGSTPAPGDMGDGEWAWSPDYDGNENPAWLFKDYDGDLHYWEPDGTL